VNQLKPIRALRLTALQIELCNLSVSRGAVRGDIRCFMFFLLRCTFWLGLVFTHMNWSLDDLAESGRDLARPVVAQAGARASGFCKDHMRDCIGALIAVTDVAQGVGATTKKSSASSLEPGDLGPTWRGAPASHGRAS
jgi:hypothetical protein